MTKFSDALKPLAADYGFGRNNGGALAAVLNNLKTPDLSEVARQSQQIEEAVKKITSQVKDINVQAKFTALQNQIAKHSAAMSEISAALGRGAIAND
jgi:ectoine hydroxylase-related dioxygenase (phytanoyl-CoA dioxygenase family)